MSSKWSIYPTLPLKCLKSIGDCTKLILSYCIIIGTLIRSQVCKMISLFSQVHHDLKGESFSPKICIKLAEKKFFKEWRRVFWLNN